MDDFESMFKREGIEKVLERYNFEPKISGSYKHNFAGIMVNMKTGKETPDTPIVQNVDWIFYSNGKPNKLVIFGYYSAGFNRIDSFLTYKRNKFPDHLIEQDLEGGWMYEDEFKKNLEYVKKQESKDCFEAVKQWKNNEIKMLYENPAFYLQNRISPLMSVKLMNLMAQINDCNADCFVDSVDFERSYPLQKFLWQPLLNEKGPKVDGKEMKCFSKKIWDALQN